MELSVCLIVKNEARNITRAILSARKVADEIIVLDTGSTDKTLALLDQIGQKYYTTTWRDSFAVARNNSISKATKPWIMWMDADDVITDDCAKRINILKQRFPDSIFMFTVTNSNTEMRPEIGTENTFLQLRMFPNGQGILFSGRVHEQISGPALARLKIYHAEDVIIEHHGYSSERHQRESLHRNIRLQMIELGFPENKDFFSFEMGPEIFCIYHPNTLAIWYRNIYMASINPFADGCPETHDERFDKMKDMVRDYLATYADGLRVCKDKNNDKMLSDIEKALETEDADVRVIA